MATDSEQITSVNQSLTNRSLAVKTLAPVIHASSEPKERIFCAFFFRIAAQWPKNVGRRVYGCGNGMRDSGIRPKRPGSALIA